MKDYGVESLTEIIDIQVLQEIQDKLAETTGLAVVIADKDGNAVTKPSCFSQFCLKIRSTETGLGRCRRSDAQLGIKASQTKEPVMSPCHAGLVDLAAPIIVNGKYLGSVLCGQVLMEEITDYKRKEMEDYLRNLDSQVADLEKPLEELTVMPEERLKGAASLLQIMAKYIVSIGISKLNEELINQKNIELMQEEASRIRLENDLKTMELKALQSQANPHFLFNTLNTIVRLAMIEGAEETEKVAYALSHLLRYTLRLIDQEVTLSDELEHVQEYLVIQQYRYGERLKFQVEVSDKAAVLKLPIMTLQPLVENAIVHALEPKVDGGTISIRTLEEDDRIKIVIEDNGLGMSEKRVNEMRQLQAVKTGRGHTTGIGFINVVKRLQHYFGDQFSFHITSALNKGTSITLICPVLKEVENSV